MPRDLVEFPEIETPVGDPVLDVLVRARKLIEAPQSWLKGDWSDWKSRQPYAEDTAWCSWGAIYRAGGRLSGEVWDEATALLGAATPSGFSGFVNFNDAPTTTHADVLALFDRAIAARKTSPEAKP